MPRFKIIHRTFLTEMLGPFFISLAVFTIMLLTAKIMELTDLVVTRGIGIGVVVQLLTYTLPFFFVWTLPMGTLLGVLLGFLRLSQDNEITAWKAAGVSPVQLAPPMAIIAFMAWALSTAITFWVLPWGNHQFENLVYRIAQSQTDLALKERVFLDQFPGLVIYVGRLPGQGNLEDVFIVDEREKGKVHTIVAKRGKLFPAVEGKVNLRLYDGTFHAVGDQLTTAQTAGFDLYDVTLETSMTNPTQRDKRHRKEMYAGELLEAMDKAQTGTQEYYLLQMEYHQKFSLPFACVVMALIGMPLGIQARAGRSWGVALALVIFMSYYMMLSAAWAFGETGYYPVVLGVWTPNILFALLGIYMLRAEQLGLEMPFMQWINSLLAFIARLKNRITGHEHAH